MLQLALCPVLLMRRMVANALSCVLYAGGMSYYMYITFLGYSALPFLERTEVGGEGRAGRRDAGGRGAGLQAGPGGEAALHPSC